MARRFGLQIVDLDTGDVVVGKILPVMHEKHDFVDRIVKRVEAKGIGLGRTKAHGLEAVRAALVDEFMAAQRQVGRPQ